MKRLGFGLCLLVALGCDGGDPGMAGGDPDAAVSSCGMAGACVPGTVRYEKDRCGEALYQPQTCSDACAWVATTDCVDPCAKARKPVPHDDAQEVCVPAGYFMRGANEPLFEQDKGSMPMREVWVSTYLVDKYPVTVRRYWECMNAMACPVPIDTAPDVLNKASYHPYPITRIRFAEAEAFCKWDGKRLPTEAEWEKAARGPAPRSQPYTWDGTEYRCDLLAHPRCENYRNPAEHIQNVDKYNELPGTRSYFGTEMMLGGGSELVSDLYGENYYSTPESLIDPQGPAESTSDVYNGYTGPVGVTRGIDRVSMDPVVRVTMRFTPKRMSDPDGSAHWGIIRCARSVEKE